jgi:hypothetical protein
LGAHLTRNDGREHWSLFADMRRRKVWPQAIHQVKDSTGNR